MRGPGADYYSLFWEDSNPKLDWGSGRVNLSKGGHRGEPPGSPFWDPFSIPSGSLRRIGGFVEPLPENMGPRGGDPKKYPFKRFGGEHTGGGEKGPLIRRGI